jgi:hypothetical protein
VSVPPAVYTQIDLAIASVNALIARAKHDDLSDLPDEEILEARTSCAAAIERLSPVGSEYRRAAEEAIARHGGAIPGEATRELVGILRALRAAYLGGYLKTLQDLVAADVFSDFLEAAEHLLDSGYKDAAAVITGAVLEEHLKKLVRQHGGSTIDGRGRPIRVDALNADLARRGSYGNLDQKNVTAWLGLRNHAAHGEYSEYDAARVKLMIEGARLFLSQHP